MKMKTPSGFNLRNLLVLHSEYVNELRKRTPETRGTYERTLREFMRWLHNEKNFQFTQKDIERYKKYLFKQKKLTHTSIVMYLTSVRKFCEYLISRGELKENPARRVRGGTPPMKHTRRSLQPEDINKFLFVIDRSNEIGSRDFSMAKLMIGNGLSEVELVRANIEDLKISRRKIEFVVQGKGMKQKSSQIIIAKDVSDALRSYLVFRSKAKPSDPLFMSAGNRTRGSRMTSRGIRERINYYLTFAGIKNGESRKITALSLRQTAIRMMMEKGATIKQIQDSFRIKKDSTVELYIHELEQRKN